MWWWNNFANSDERTHKLFATTVDQVDQTWEDTGRCWSLTDFKKLRTNPFGHGNVKRKIVGNNWILDKRQKCLVKWCETDVIGRIIKRWIEESENLLMNVDESKEQKKVVAPLKVDCIHNQPSLSISTKHWLNCPSNCFPLLSFVYSHSGTTNRHKKK